ncbi:16S rRNA (cytosine(1402)-N(4))-methyltransferase RsmH [Candidatus Saganbacteria bacterium]|nr:16S rRNA (cytosine(1402)-N(4))-methyltransferase RsmH [Candidatus Saganbacteria bacterium]
MSNFHNPVMPIVTIESLNLKKGGTYVDCTLGGGGHAENVKCQMSNVKLIGIDQDNEALAEAHRNLETKEHSDIEYVHGNFSDIGKLINKPVDGFLFDLGISSHQINEESRGFSIRSDAPLDMRMDKGSQLTAYSVVNGYSKEELTRIFFEYGEERFSKRVSNAIWQTRDANPIKTTFQLKDIIEKAIPTWKKRESVTRIFQALRIEVNHELESLKKGFSAAVEKLNPGGRIVVISYHSLEDRIVKWFFRDLHKNGILKIITKKPILPSEEEILANPRARSAKLRCAEKT